MNAKTAFKRAAAVLALLALSALTPAAVSANEPTVVNVYLRIEGISENLYYGEVQVPCEGTLSVKDALAYADAQSDSLVIEGLDSGFVSAIGGDVSGTFGGWDGWLFTVNGEEATVGIAECLLSDGDSVLLYYGDPYGVGMQFPQADTSRLGDGILKFTSKDTTFDENWEPVVTVNPVAGATVRFYSGEDYSEYITDQNGEASIPASLLTPGEHRVQVEKYGDTAVSGKYLPLVLRLAPDFTVTVEDTSKPGTSEPGTSEPPSKNGIPDTADRIWPAGAGLLAALCALTAALGKKAYPRVSG